MEEDSIKIPADSEICEAISSYVCFLLIGNGASFLVSQIISWALPVLLIFSYHAALRTSVVWFNGAVVSLFSMRMWYTHTFRANQFYRNLRCGKLICTYPYSTPFATDAAAVLYVQVREHLCISLDYLNVPARLDPLMIPPGTKCGSGKVRKHFIVN